MVKNRKKICSRSKNSYYQYDKLHGFANKFKHARTPLLSEAAEKYSQTTTAVYQTKFCIVISTFWLWPVKWTGAYWHHCNLARGKVTRKHCSSPRKNIQQLKVRVAAWVGLYELCPDPLGLTLVGETVVMLTYIKLCTTSVLSIHYWILQISILYNA